MAQVLLLSRGPETALAALRIGQLRRLHGLRENYGQCHEPGKVSICLMAHVCIMAHVCLTANRQNQLLLLSRRPEAALAALRIGKLRRLHGLRKNYGQCHKLGKSSICLMAHVCIMAQVLLLSRRPETALASLRIGKLRRLHGLRKNYGQGNKLGKSFARL